QAEVVRSEQMVKITEKQALAAAEAAKGEGSAIRLRGQAEADAIRAVGAAKAEAYRQGKESLGQAGYTAMQPAAVLRENKVKLVPEIAMGGDGSGKLVDALLGKLLVGANGGGEA